MNKILWGALAIVVAVVIFTIITKFIGIESCDRPDDPENNVEYYKNRIATIEKWHAIEMAELNDSVTYYKGLIRSQDSTILSERRDLKKAVKRYDDLIKGQQNASNDELVETLLNFIDSDTGKVLLPIKSGQVLELNVKLYERQKYKEENTLMAREIDRMESRNTSANNLIATLERKCNADSVHCEQIKQELASVLNDYGSQIEISQDLQKKNRRLRGQRIALASAVIIETLVIIFVK